MSDRIQVLPDLIPNIGFNFDSQETFSKDHGLILEHWAAIPSTIGQKDRGDLRRPDSLDTMSENGYIYKKVGEFIGTILGNGLKNKHGEGGITDNSTARLMMSKFYTKECGDEKEIALLPGDRLYAKQIELVVPNYQKVEFTPKANCTLQFPAKSVQFLIDSNNTSYTEGVQFKISSEGDIQWIDGQANPGIDSDTGRGRIFGIRYSYLAHWYVSRLINEIRVTNNGDASSPVRLPYHAEIQREYVYHQKNRGAAESKSTETQRTQDAPVEVINPNEFQIKVDVSDFED